MCTNPILPGFNPDPSIIRVNEDFFLVSSSFEYFPGAPIYHSTDLIQWTLIGHALTRPSQLQIHTPEPGGGIWATTLRYHKDTFYITAAKFDRYRPQDDDRVWPRGFYVSTTDIWDSASWSDPVYFDQVGFDQDLFWDDDDTVYLSSTYRKLARTPGANLKDFAIHISTVDLATGRSTSEPKLIRESASGVAEGSHIFKRGKYYYLFTAEGGTESGHCEWVCRSKTSPFGPWEDGPSNPLWRNGVTDEVQNTGHADMVEDAQGRWWAVLLGVRPVRRGDQWEESVLGESTPSSIHNIESSTSSSQLTKKGRETFLIPVEWSNDWPIFNGGQKISLTNTTPHLHQVNPPPPPTWRDNFDTPTLQLGWYRKNTPICTAEYSLTERPGHLRLHGGPYNLSVPASPTLFLRKQTHRMCTWTTSLSFHPTSSSTEAGTVLWWNYFTYSSLGIRRAADGRRIVRLRPADGQHIDRVLEGTSEGGNVQLIIECGDHYRFGFREESPDAHRGPEAPINWIGEVSNTAMTVSPPVGMAFTGMMLGLYAFGERQPCLVPADFEYAEMR
ncbi:putative glycosyl hydrolase [Aspergillus campestris IBT 28561]|uniref:Glycosyl hydrolase n=1 Tax=Aspergillus campestris (strain IBT 28561) TaxID=1392248 RepID=A0A2I1D4Y9_ASPC2|nr:putative glycosyl hydrolase [Aspergillus campestris IBT 28561]PKY04951.1 putative glycosyl hydrolase [Aspergillus campestris IBT 28561]